LRCHLAHTPLELGPLLRLLLKRDRKCDLARSDLRLGRTIPPLELGQLLAPRRDPLLLLGDPGGRLLDPRARLLELLLPSLELLRQHGLCLLSAGDLVPARAELRGALPKLVVELHEPVAPEPQPPLLLCDLRLQAREG